MEKNVIDIYVKRVKKYLPFFCQDRKKFLNGLKQEIQDYVTLQSDCDLISLYATFGAPQNMAAQFLDTLDPAEVSKFQRKRKIILIGLIFLLLLIIFSLVIYLHKQIQINPSKVEVTIKESQPYHLTDEEIEEMIRQEENKNE
ncbi:DUF6120 family protein [Sinanaerobacter sp. ZZT-01]|uniref:DUF6120 family protein n=1 Tax=Sinanaerobacter sp. ZZT-01 TaxID=3111540 RepID=UPI002D78EE58|nr:DUF6120 family protein [Sinanaerobacter sp. ZZT-01]WRR94647.1 DUF6120 family protein [Sinanaerobacter sp. ZZT-01]